MDYLQVPLAGHDVSSRLKGIGPITAGQATKPSPTATPSKPSAAQREQVIVLKPNEIELGAKEQRLRCPYCRRFMLSVVQPKCTYRTHLVALLMCVLGAWCCAPMPYCMDTCKTLKHYCSQCDRYLGKCDM